MMKAESQQPEGQEDAISVLNAAIEALDLADKNSGIAEVRPVLATANTLLKMIRVRFLLLYNDLVSVHISD
jgi:hypothetical protein